MSDLYLETYVPAIMAVSVAPNPSLVGSPVIISVSAIDVAAIPSTQVYACGEFYSGEV